MIRVIEFGEDERATFRTRNDAAWSDPDGRLCHFCGHVIDADQLRLVWERDYNHCESDVYAKSHYHLAHFE
jgi:hypothetical protein